MSTLPVGSLKQQQQKYLPFVPLHRACRLVCYCMDAGIIYFLFLEKTSLKHLFWKKTHIKNYMDFANRYEKLYFRKGRLQFRPKGVVILP